MPSYRANAVARAKCRRGHFGSRCAFGRASLRAIFVVGSSPVGRTSAGAHTGARLAPKGRLERSRQRQQRTHSRRVAAQRSSTPTVGLEPATARLRALRSAD